MRVEALEGQRVTIISHFKIKAGRWAATDSMRSILFLFLLIGPAAPAFAHPLAPALLEIRELGEGLAEVSWKTSRLRPRGADVRPVLPDTCLIKSEPRFEEAAQSVTQRFTVDCGQAGLIGQTIAVRGLEATKIDAFVRIQLEDGRVINGALRAGEAEFIVPARAEKSQVLRSYIAMGFQHILTGPDHLLFVLGLILLIVALRPLVKTITAFTVGHSVTLSIAALGFVNIPSALIEILIAGSVLLLAVELSRPGDSPGRLQQRPWIMAFGFGLLHGMGFAGALSEVGLPNDEIPLALFSFNVGIELGQLGFVLVVLVGFALLRGPLSLAPAWLKRVPAYGIGILATFWCLERTAAIF